jgi:hypothetical protein
VQFGRSFSSSSATTSASGTPERGSGSAKSSSSPAGGFGEDVELLNAVEVVAEKVDETVTDLAKLGAGVVMSGHLAAILSGRRPLDPRGAGTRTPPFPRHPFLREDRPAFVVPPPPADLQVSGGESLAAELESGEQRA